MTLARTAEVRSYAMLSSLDFAVWLDHLQKDTSGTPTGSRRREVTRGKQGSSSSNYTGPRGSDLELGPFQGMSEKGRSEK